MKKLLALILMLSAGPALAWTDPIIASLPLSAASASVANATATATLTPPAGKTIYAASFLIQGLGATAAQMSTLTISGIVGGNLVIPIAVPTGVGVAFSFVWEKVVPLQGVAPGTAVVATLSALGSGSIGASVAITGWAN